MVAKHKMHLKSILFDGVEEPRTLVVLCYVAGYRYLRDVPQTDILQDGDAIFLDIHTKFLS